MYDMANLKKVKTLTELAPEGMAAYLEKRTPPWAPNA